MATLLDCARISEDVYSKKVNFTSDSWVEVGQPVINKSSGFYSRLYRNKKSAEFVIALRGTEVTDWGDIVADLAIIKRKLSPQFIDAYHAYEAYKRTIKSNKFLITGHSLGGALAKYIAARYGEKAIAFNAPGIKGMGAGLASMHHKATIHNVNALLDPVSKFGDSFGTNETWHVSSMPLIPDVLEPIIVGKAIADTAGLASGLIGGAYMVSQHSISNLVVAIKDNVPDKLVMYKPKRTYMNSVLRTSIA
ncbi:MAG: hypothetical protein OEY89_06750 [Gammaproteobacteria bacterium]|nr:hypothetical protein [Gammaproteobacteria bacterium]